MRPSGTLTTRAPSPPGSASRSKCTTSHRADRHVEGHCAVVASNLLFLQVGQGETRLRIVRDYYCVTSSGHRMRAGRRDARSAESAGRAAAGPRARGESSRRVQSRRWIARRAPDRPKSKREHFIRKRLSPRSRRVQAPAYFTCTLLCTL